MTEKYFINFNNQILGPYSEADLITLISKGYLPSFTRCQKEGEKGWRILKDWDHFAKYLPEDDLDEGTIIRKIKNQQIDETQITQVEQEFTQSIKKLKRYKDEIRNKASDEEQTATRNSKTKNTVKHNFPVQSKKDQTQFISREDLLNEIESSEEISTQVQNLVALKDKLMEKGKTKKKAFYAIFVILLLVFLFSPDQEEKKAFDPDKDLKSYEMKFPVAAAQSNEANASAEYSLGVDSLEDYSYKNLTKAAEHFRKSYEFSQSKNALEKLTLSYALLMKYSSEMRKDAVTVFNLLKILGEGQELRSLDVLTAKAYFYFYLKKYNASVYADESYLKLNRNVTPLLFAVYLNALLQSGDLVKAKKVFAKINEVENKNVYAYESILTFLKLNNDLDLYGKVFTEALTKYQKSLEILLQGCHFYLEIGDTKILSQALDRIENLDYGHNRIFYAKYLEYSGMLASLSNKPKKALIFFQKALKINESPDLRAKIATLKSNISSRDINALIKESKVVNAINNAQNLIKNNQYSLAMNEIVNGLNEFPNYLPAKLLLAKIEIHQGYFQQGVSHLEALRDSDPLNENVNIELLKAYAISYRLDKAFNLMNQLSNTAIQKNADFASTVSLYYEKKKDILQAILWLHRSINLDPVNDSMIAHLAQLYLDNNKFDKAKQLINRAVMIDPTNIEYKIIYANILYELDNVDTAVGYLRNELKEFPGSSDILNQIAIFYYKSGQIKSFENLKKEIKNISRTNNRLFLFLMNAALLEDRPSEVVENAKEYLQSDPSNLEVKMLLAKTLMGMKRYDQAIEVLKSINERAENYPNLQYYRAKMFLMIGQVNDAIDAAKQEIASNPGSVYGHVILGDIYLQDEQYTLAENSYKAAQKRDTNSAEALKGLAYIKFKKNQMDAAIDLYQKAIKIQPDNAELYLELGDVYRYKGQVKDALEYYRIYLKLEPESKQRANLENYIRSME